MRVPITIYAGGGIDCHDEECQYCSGCANHHTAGDFRNEDGFTPHLSLLPLENMTSPPWVWETIRWLDCESKGMLEGVYARPFDHEDLGALIMSSVGIHGHKNSVVSYVELAAASDLCEENGMLGAAGLLRSNMKK